MSPGRRAVHGHIEGEVTDDLDPLLCRVGVELFPLAVELELQEAVEIDLLRQVLRRRFQGFGVAQALPVLPVHPGPALIFLFQGHIERIVSEPVVFLLQILLILRMIIAVCRRTFQLPEPVKGDPQDLIAVIVQSPVVDLLRIRAEIKAIHLIPGQQPLFDQLLQVDEVGVAGKR